MERRGRGAIHAPGCQTRLLAGLNGGWELVFAQFTQDEFLLRATNLQMRGQLCREFHDAMIEERRAHFDGMSHAHAVAFHQDVVGQIIFLIEPQKVRQSVAGFWQLVYFIQEMVKSSGKRWRSSDRFSSSEKVPFQYT